MKTRFLKSLIHSRYALAYEQAQQLVDGKQPQVYKSKGWTGGDVAGEDIPWLRQTILHLLRIGRVRSAQRKNRGGAIDLTSDRPEVKFSTSLSTQEVEVHTSLHLEIHDTIAELMILANEAVARRLLELHPTHALLRMHPPSVDPIKFAECAAFAERLGWVYCVSLSPRNAKCLSRTTTTPW